MSSICNSCQRQPLPCRVAWRTTRTTTSPCRTTRQIPSRSRGCQPGMAAILQLMPWPAAVSPTTGLERRTLCANETRHTTDISTTLARNVGRVRKVPAMIVVIVVLRLCAPMNNPSAGKPSLACPEGHRANQGPPPPPAPLPNLGANFPKTAEALVGFRGVGEFATQPGRR